MDYAIPQILYFGAGLFAGIINALAGGGSVLTLAALTVTGIDPRIANLTSTVALSPGQMAAGYRLRKQLIKARLGSAHLLALIALIGGAFGAGMLLATTASAFRAVVPWLVLLATLLYAASAFPTMIARITLNPAQPISRLIFAMMSVYGGYFGGGNSFLILALFGMTGHDPRLSGEIKNVLLAVINLGAVAVFAASGLVEWRVALAIGAGGLLGSLAGASLLQRLSVTIIRLFVIAGGLMLAGWMFAG